jgi:hypothetical protein
MTMRFARMVLLTMLFQPLCGTSMGIANAQQKTPPEKGTQN